MKPLLSTLALIVLPAFALAQNITLTGGKTDEANIVVKVPLKDAAAITGVQFDDERIITAQVVKPALTDDPAVKQYAVFVLSNLKAGQTVTGTLKAGRPLIGQSVFRFEDKPGEPEELLYVNASARTSRPVLQFFNLPHDPKMHYYTFKPFHHVYDPVDGKTLLTSGTYKQNYDQNSKDPLYPHHRGMFFGYYKISYGNETLVDTWHGPKGEFTQVDKSLSREAGPVLGRKLSAISWHGRDGKEFANEEREVTAYAVTGGTLIDWSTVLSTKLDKVRLDGDPQHSGFHFRANMEVSKNGKDNTYFLRPDGKGKMGETRNWEPKGKDAKTVNLPWNACSFMVGGKRYTVLRVSHPDNPKESRGSERDYGRFGDYFEYDLTPDKPLKMKYRVWVQAGEMTVEQCEQIAAGFVSPPAIKVAVGK